MTNIHEDVPQGESPNNPPTDPSEFWAAYAMGQTGGQKAAPVERPADGSHEAVQLPPPGDDPVTQAPGYTKTPLPDIAHQLTVPDSLASLSVTPPRIGDTQPVQRAEDYSAPTLVGTSMDVASEQRWYQRRRNQIIAAIAIVATAAGIGAAVTSGGGKTSAEKSPAASAPLVPGQKAASSAAIPSQTTETSAAAQVPASTAAETPSATGDPMSMEQMPDYINNVQSFPGNIDPSMWDVGSDGINLQPPYNVIPIPGFPKTGFTEPNKLAKGVLSLVSVMMSFPQDSPNWNTAVHALFAVDSNKLDASSFLAVQKIRALNTQFHKEQGTNPHPEHVNFFDTRGDKVTIEQVDADQSPRGSATFEMTGGTLYERRVRNDAKVTPDAAAPVNFYDIYAYTPEFGRKVKTLRFTVKELEDSNGKPTGQVALVDLTLSFAPYNPAQH